MSDDPSGASAGDAGATRTDGDGGESGTRGDDWPASGPPPLWLRLGIAVVVAVFVAVVVGAIPPLTADQAPTTEPVTLNNSEYAADDLAVTEVPAEGEIRADVEGEGTVVFDEDHVNDFDREDVEPLVEAFSRAGYEVVFHERGDLGDALEDAVAYVVYDPGSEFEADDRSAVRNFTDDGGRVVVFSEPSQVAVSSGRFGGAQLSVDRGGGEDLLREYGLSIRTSYVYNQRVNDGGFKNPVATPVGPAAGAGEDVALYTAARIVALEGDNETVLRLPEDSGVSGDDETGAFPVAVRSGNLIAVGDTTLLGVGRYNVADNEEFLAYLVEFLLSGPRAETVPRVGTG